MSAAEIQGGPGPAGADPPEWEKTLSREIGDLVRGAQALGTLWNARFGSDAFQNPLFVRAYAGQTQGHAILGVYRAVHDRDHPTDAEGTPSFEERFRRSAEGVAEGSPEASSGGDAVPINPFHYLERSLEQVRVQKDAGFLVDPEPTQRLLTFLGQLKDIPALGGFRRDLLEAFPSKVELTPRVDEQTAPESALRELPEGTRLGKVQVVRRIGVGGFAQVYLVFHPGLHEHRAAKLFTKQDLLGELPGLMKAFYAEAQLQNTLKHPNIVRVLDVEEHEGYLVLLMEYVEGRNLRSLIEERKKAKAHLAPLEILTIALEVAKGLGHAHRLGIMHRDIKPENILIAADGAVKITDFGLAKTLNDSGQRRTTRLGQLLGTPQYMAPEQVFGETYDCRVDLYALGAVIYHMAWGQPPFIGRDAWKILERQRDEKPVPLAALMKGFPADLGQIVMKLLEKKPEHRFQTAQELTQALEACREGLFRKEPLPLRKRHGARVLAGVAALLFVAGGWAALHESAGKKGKELRGGSPGERPGPLGHSTEPREDLVKIPRPASSEPRNSEAPAQTTAASAPEGAKDLSSPLPPSTPEPKPSSLSLREQLRTVPVSAEDLVFTQRLLGIFSSHRGELLLRRYQAIQKDLEALVPLVRSDYSTTQTRAARDLVDLAAGLVQGRWKALAESKGPVLIHLANGSVAEGQVERVTERALTLRDGAGGEFPVLLEKLALQEFVGTKALPAAEVAFQALSGDAGLALSQAPQLEKSRENVAFWYPVLVRLAVTALREELRELLGKLEAPLAAAAKGETLKDPKNAELLEAAKLRAHALEAEMPEILSLYPWMESEFKEARRELEALDLLLGREYSRLLSAGVGTEGYPLAATLLLAGFRSELERAPDELIAKAGWFNNRWELHPDEPSVEERIKYWDLLEDGGCVLRDAKGPRSLVMGRPHPRASEGVQLQFEFEPLGPDRSGAHWRFNLRRVGGGTTALRFDQTSVSLWTLPLTEGSVAESLASAQVPAAPDGRKLHTCLLIPGERLHVFVDGSLVLSLQRTDAILPGQFSVAVQGGKLSLRSLLVLKAPAK